MLGLDIDPYDELKSSGLARLNTMPSARAPMSRRCSLARFTSGPCSPRETVISWYRPLGPSRYDANVDARKLLLDRPWTHWRDALVAELSQAHPDLAALATRIDITRYGHAMAMPTPGTLAQLWPLSQGARAIGQERLSFAHADWSGYSIFEEAFTRGHWAGLAAAGRAAA